MALKETWKTLAPERKRKFVLAGTIALVLLLGAGGYQMRSKPVPHPRTEEKSTSLIQSPGMLQKSLYQQSQRELAKRDRQMEELRGQLATLMEKDQDREKEGQENSPGPPSTERPVTTVDTLKYPPPPPPGTVYPAMPSQSAAPPPPEEIVAVGDIGMISAPVSEIVADKKKADGQRIYLPPSFMAATLLSGLDAPTSESAKGSPVPALLRIKDLAVLPNSVKADLKGCFVIAEGLGNLADERAHMRLVSLSCLTREGQSVIDQKIKGFLVDQDGKIGLKGRVVSRMGSAIARSMIAGFFGGLGEYVAAQNTITSTSPLGTTQTINTGDALQYGAGSGLASAFKDTQKFYLDLAKQALPVIEVGATKDVTLVIEEGIMLELRDPDKEKN
ncbi:conjugal transfer protein TraB [Desulfuromonas sp. DDH964]|uniref:TraB/VirB10 family protein n=1 Tax=Desulfuromonas sp. DDH964 TaxID=1823759 RepID=UPI00078B60AA|nr:TraB/VirB10 family protein [Desulfuromonas sp. DDH964]AMV70758.1 conjugal transfer protein TraB [Desulfuromonas sp. DDH964]